MNSLKNEESVDTNYLIRFFLDAATGETPHVEASLVARLTDGTIAVFQDINKGLINRANGSPETQSYSFRLGRSFDRLRLWSDGYEISSGTFDHIFERSSRLRGATLEVLCSIGSTLTERLVASTWVMDLLGKSQLSETFTNKVEQLRQLIQEAEDDHSKSEFSTGSSEYDDDDITQIMADLETDTRSLMDLDGLFSEPILNAGDMRQPLASSFHNWEPHEPYSQIISKQFPKANEELITVLGKANYERFLRGQKQRDSNIWDPWEDPNDPVMLPPSLTRDPEAASSKFNDSGLGSSIPSSYAETIMSYHNGEGPSVRLPTLPKSARNGSSFRCIACGAPTSAQDTSAWRRHLYNDLRPWQCLELSCGQKGGFSTRGDWVSHLSLDHFGPEWKDSECPLCRQKTGCGKTVILNHFGGHLEEISLAALPLKHDSDTESMSSDTNQQDEAIGCEAEQTSPKAEVHDTDLPNTADHNQSLEMRQGERVTYEEAMDYIREVRRQSPELYDDFMTLLLELHNQKISTEEFCVRLADVFSDAPDFRDGQRFAEVFLSIC